MYSHLIDVLVPAYNNSQGVKAILAGFEGVKGVRIIVSDDSTEKTATQLIRNVCSHYSCDYFDGPKMGAISNWNFLLEKVRSEYFVFVHHDELIIEHSWLDKLRTPSKALSKCIHILPYSVQSKDGHWRHHTGAQQSLSHKAFARFLPFWNYIGPTASFICPRSALVPFRHELIWLVDCVWFYECLIRNNQKIRFHTTPSVRSYFYAESITWGGKDMPESKFSIEFMKIKKQFNINYIMPWMLVFAKIVIRCIFIKNWFKTLVLNFLGMFR